MSAKDDAGTTMEGRVISLTGDRKRSTKTGGVRRWITGALAAAVVAGTALIASPAGAATPPQISLVTGFQGTATVTVGHPKVASTAQISPSFVAYNATTGDQAVASTVDGSTFVYLIAGANATSGEYGVATGALTAGDAYVVAGNGTAGLVADPGDSADPLATDNPISPTSVNFDNNGNLIISGSFGSDAAAQQATQVVAKATGTFYGVAMTAGDLYTLAGIGLAGLPSYALNYPIGINGYGVTVDSQGNIIIGSSGEVYMINESGAPVTRYGTTVPAATVQLISGSAGGSGTCAPPASLPTQGNGTSYLQFPNPTVDANGNIYINDNQVPSVNGPGYGCVWVVPAQTGTVDGLSVTAGNMYPVAGNGGVAATSTSGIAATSANVSTTSATAIDPAGNLLLASQGAGVNGTLPALQVVAESNGTYYGQAMTAGDIYTIAGGSASGTTIPGDASAFGLAGPTSLASDGLGNVFMTDGATASANLYEVTGGPTGPAAQPPTVTSISPTSGPQAGGTSVTITGTNLTGATGVKFGTAAATGVVVNSATSVTAISPAGTGTVNVTVTTPNGTSTGTAGQFTYNAPAAGQGYWEVASDGGIFNFGDAAFFGSEGDKQLNAPIVGIAATPDGKGYWEVASDGGIFTFGDATFLGSEGGSHLNAPVVGMAATSTGNGYWLVASDGGIFTFGDAGFLGSEGNAQLNAAVVGIASTPDGKGYWLVASDGGIFTFGDAGFLGSEGGSHLNAPVVGMAATSTGNGYWLVASDGGIFNFGDAGFLGSEGGSHLNAPVAGIAGIPDPA